jgi:hypothetical protein
LERGCVQSTSRNTWKNSAASGVFQQAGFAKLLHLAPLCGTQPRSGGAVRGMRPTTAQSSSNKLAKRAVEWQVADVYANHEIVSLQCFGGVVFCFCFRRAW